MSVGYDGSIKINTKIDTVGVTTGTRAINAGLALVKGSAAEAGAALAAAFAPAIILSAIVTIGNALINLGKQAIELASDLNEVQNVVETTFGSASEKIDAFADTAIRQFGLSELAAKKYASTMGAMLKSMGFSLSDATEMSIKLAGLAGDMASFYNLDADEAFEKLRSGISGETEPLKQLGINLSVANLEAYALSRGITASYNSMTEAQKAALRYEYILSATGDAQGDFAKTSDSWANQTRILSEQWKEFLSILGGGLIKILTPLLRVLNKLLEGLIGIATAIGDLINMIFHLDEVSDSNTGISTSADDAAESETSLADGINEAAEAADNALAKFDKLDVLQQNLSGGSGISFDTSAIGDLKDALDEVESDAEEKDIEVVVTPTFPDPPLPELEPVTVDIVPNLVTPFYTVEDWGLVPPLVPEPEFPQLPVPVYEPVWNLADSLGAEFEKVKTRLSDLGLAFENSLADLKQTVSEAIGETNTSFTLLDAKVAETQENTAYNTAEMARVNTANINTWAENSAVISGQFAENTTTPVHDAAQNMMDNLTKAFNNTYENFYTWAASTSVGFGLWGNAVIDRVHDTSVGMRDSFVDSLSSMWNNFVGWAQSVGTEISSFWSENKETIIKTTIVVAAVTGIAAALILSGGTLAPAIVAGSAALAAVPALASGAVIPPNSEFLAILGDQKSGTNIEAPEGLIRKIVREETGGNARSMTVEMPVYLDSEIIYKGQKKVEWRRGQKLVQEGTG